MVPRRIVNERKTEPDYGLNAKRKKKKRKIP